MADRRLDVVTGSDLLLRPKPHRDWLVEGLVMRGRFGFIGGPPKSYKTVTELMLAVHLATGTDLLDFRVKRPGRVLVIHQEDSDDYIQEQLGKIITEMGLGERVERGREIRPMVVEGNKVIEMGLHAVILHPPHELLDRNLRLVLNQGVDLLKEEDWNAVDEEMAKFAPDLTIVNTTISVMPGVKAKEYAEISRAINFPRTLARKHRSAMFCVHHSNKEASGSGGENLMDSNAFHAASECSIYAHKKHKGRKLPREKVRWEREIKGVGGLEDLLIEVTETSRTISYAVVEDDDDDHTEADEKKPPSVDEDAIRQVLRNVPGHRLSQNKLIAELRAAGYAVSVTKLPKLLKAMPDVDWIANAWELINDG
jgi:AAA domain